ncbi:helix-turn-helix domain-containing protein [Kitasatospora sp. CM 4170]|uniref:TetR/AcrR family transcriptional regulator n=1 Tax=Kitasatospora aburaviensis TaxID=67265 RepID=A0ABW1EUY4_9ACTN|nr:helix-turn-helix domain-containing protein [Kitasatospora sp. CM 4170]WNM45095.1 helix-turn-helix domain-containing protein [Kitasatospora sp. CM 4170]
MAHNDNGPQSASAIPPAGGPTAGGGAVPLELLRTPPPSERADAARNRAAVLEAAARLFAEHGVEAVSMDQVAAAAGVGKGTLFRRFGDKAGLGVALLDARERTLQEAILRGPAPLGPGGPATSGPAGGATSGTAGTPQARPTERLAAFVDAYLDYLLEHLDLVRMSETASRGARYRVGAYRFWHRHTAILLAAAGAADPEHDAHALLAALAAEHVAALLPELGEERIRAGAVALAGRLAR